MQQSKLRSMSLRVFDFDFDLELSEVYMNGMRLTLIVAMGLISGFSNGSLFAQSSNWQGGNFGNWNAASWSNGIPGYSNNFIARFQNYPGTNTVNLIASPNQSFGGIVATNSNNLDLRLNGHSMSFTASGQLNGTITVSSNSGGSGITSPTFAFTFMNLELKDGGILTATSVSSSASGVVKLSSGGTLNLNTTDSISLPGVSFQFNGGTLNSQGVYRLQTGQALNGYGALNTRFVGFADSSLTVSGGDFSAGASDPNGFSTTGNVTVQSGRTLNVNDSNFATFGGLIELQGGTIQNVNSNAFSGVSLAGGSTLVGHGSVNTRVTADTGSAIMASGGDLTIGNNSKLSFFGSGDLHTNNHTVTLLGSNRATLGNATSLGNGTAGTLIVSNGAFLDFGRTITGFGTIDSQNVASKAMIINGDVIGKSASQQLTFNGYVKGIGTFENVVMNGTFAPGLSPAISYVDNLTLGNNAVLEMEIGGLAPGSQYDKLIDSGLLALNGTLKLILIDGYNPTAGATFDLIDWNSSIGSFANIDFSLAGLDTGLAWDTSALYTTGSVSVTAVPEPSAILLVGSVMAMTVARRRRT